MMGTPAAGYVYVWKPSLFLVSSDEVLRDDRWLRIKRLTIRRHGVVIKFSDGVKVEAAQGDRWYTRRPAQWIAPNHTGTMPGMPPGAGRP
ncbi:hypothetical protein ACOKM3_14225 [Streptomyces sp. BH106]|uniref:hypothetical protein n=1 Tax=Streptomyces sp. BH106 TaxID=3410409 RepID=UPI003CECFC8E